MDTIEAIHQRRSIRAYDPRLVDRALIAAVILDAAQAPTPPISGEAPLAFTVVEGVEKLEVLGERALAYAREHRPAGPGWDWVERPGFRVFWDAPGLIVISCPAQDSQAAENTGRTGQALMLSALARGLGTCWVGAPMQWLRDPAVAEELGVPAGFRAAAAFLIGYARTVPPPPPPRPAPPIVWR